VSSTPPPARHGLGDPRIPWVVLLDLAWAGPRDDLAERLGLLAAEAGWPVPGPGTITSGAPEALLPRLASNSPEPLRVGRYDGGLVLAARHDALDGLAMLTAARRLLSAEIRSSARGLTVARSAGRSALLKRLAEVAIRPPARVAGSSKTGPAGDVFAAMTVAGTARTADLVLAGARAVGAWNHEYGRSARRTSVAIGVSTLGGEADALSDASAFLRLTDVEELDAGQVRAAMTSAAVQPGGAAADSEGLLGRAAATALRLAAPRLGSTLLVSHLGTLAAPDALERAAFYPVTGGGSGVSLGAATLRGSTTITLRARAARYDDDALQQLLERVVANLEVP
jgi:hypothetical protein